MTDNPELIRLYADVMKKALTASLYDESAWVVVDSSRQKPVTFKTPIAYLQRRAKDWLARSLGKRRLALVKTLPLDLEKRAIGQDWPLFGFTMAGHRRLENVEHCIAEIVANQVPGDLIETGAWRGGTTIFMRGLLKAYGVTDRRVWVADSFEGLPAPKDAADGWDYSQNRFLKVSLEQVQANFERFGLLDDQVRFLKGWFCDTLPQAPIERLALLRLDGDMYSSTMDALCNLYHKVSPGGYVIVDDYYSWPSCQRAVTEFLTEHGLKPNIQRVDWTAAFWRVD